MNTRLKSAIFLTIICGSLLLLAISCKKEGDEAETVTDVDGNVYNTVQIGSQIWMKENLKVTKYNNGEDIPNVTGGTAWKNLTSGAYCDYDNNNSNSNTYGRLYNWYAISTLKLCPAGWHIPTYDEWSALTLSLGGDQVAGGKMKEKGTAHWNSPNEGADNESGFTGLPGGYRYPIGLLGDGEFGEIGNYGLWWSSTVGSGSGTTVSILQLGFDYRHADRGGSYKNGAASVRCIKD